MPPQGDRGLVYRANYFIILEESIILPKLIKKP